MVPAPGFTLSSQQEDLARHQEDLARLQIVKTVTNNTTFFHPLNPDDRGQGQKAVGVLILRSCLQHLEVSMTLGFKFPVPFLFMRHGLQTGTVRSGLFLAEMCPC